MFDNEKSPRQEIASLNLDLDESGSGVIKLQCERRHPRTNLSSLNKILDEKISFLPVDLATTSCGKRKGMLIDISENGCRIAVTAPLQKGEMTNIQFTVNRKTITTHAVVRWISPKNPVYMVGLEFKGMPDDIREYLWAISGIALMDGEEIARMKEALEQSPAIL